MQDSLIKGSSNISNEVDARSGPIPSWWEDSYSLITAVFSNFCCSCVMGKMWQGSDRGETDSWLCWHLLRQHGEGGDDEMEVGLHDLDQGCQTRGPRAGRGPRSGYHVLLGYCGQKGLVLCCLVMRLKSWIILALKKQALFMQESKSQHMPCTLSRPRLTVCTWLTAGVTAKWVRM